MQPIYAGGRSSFREKDLVDIVVLLKTEPVDGWTDQKHHQHGAPSIAPPEAPPG
ncbi:hypothetical protein [Gulosibacter sp. 10]|uniref:hypothetical protein n=1 Tax=Gulosibacter sp. 10 TaxID=1255570 RepID=UPI00097EE5FE|nr:hypothetical protein [Gulosibacter sp. 10]SJM66340.1 hypothetical protein FM112_11690 [Gulosibacter sp. 10]